MKPNNLIALLIVAILLAIGIALAIINQRSEGTGHSKATEKTSSARLGQYERLT